MQDPDPRNFLDVTATKDKRYILLNRNSKRRSGVSMLDARQPWTASTPILEDADFTYFVEVRVITLTLHALILVNRSCCVEVPHLGLPPIT